MDRARKITTSVAASAAVALFALSSCGPRPQFAGELFYGNLLHDNASDDLRESILPQVTDAARAAGLTLTESDPRRLVFVTQAPNWTGQDADGNPVERADSRRITVELEMGGVHGVETYRYRATIAGEEPGGFTPEARARLGRALVALREVFEQPLERDLFPLSMEGEGP